MKPAWQNLANALGLAQDLIRLEMTTILES